MEDSRAQRQYVKRTSHKKLYYNCASGICSLSRSAVVIAVTLLLIGTGPNPVQIFSPSQSSFRHTRALSFRIASSETYVSLVHSAPFAPALLPSFTRPFLSLPLPSLLLPRLESHVLPPRYNPRWRRFSLTGSLAD